MINYWRIELRNVQVSDTTKVDSSNKADKVNILSQLETFQKLCIEIPRPESFVLH